MIAYIDEYGDPNLNTHSEGVTKYYILCAIIVDDNENILESQIEGISTSMFSGAEIKSSRIGNDNKRRIEILKLLRDVQYYSIALIIDKDLLFGEGLAFRRSFFKFFNGRLIQLLLESYPGIVIKHDEYGKDSFMQEFEKYINNKYPDMLFSPFQDSFVKSNRNRFIQLADFLAGSIAKAIDKKCTAHKNIASLLTNEKLYIEYWPNHKRKEPEIEITQDSQLDLLIETISFNCVIDYIETYKETSDGNIRLQVQFLKYLINVFDYISKNKYTYTHEIIENLSHFHKDISIYYIRNRIVAPLRDYGIPIASTSQGYKIPSKKEDIVEFIKHTKGVIEPMQHRLQIILKKYLLLSNGRINLRNGYGFPEYIKTNNDELF